MEDMTIPNNTADGVDYTSLLGSLMLAATVTLVIGYIIGRVTRKLHNRSKERDATETASLKNQFETQPPSADQQSAPAGNNTTGKQRAKSQKRREAQQMFQNSWLIGALKGHTGLILDMDLSQNGKYLASSAEDYGSRIAIGPMTLTKTSAAGLNRFGADCTGHRPVFIGCLLISEQTLFKIL
ncbi:transducin beta-like protein 2 [Odontomachus brunneus]|uniref:transducin beta-like protein 2 n=1 Tax=Odontomachus brunneus TaxID=486640 RepID=UPI0013F1F959|nr:transducin beta-like protein 2 [Odontomachus brunneus]